MNKHTESRLTDEDVATMTTAVESELRTRGVPHNDAGVLRLELAAMRSIGVTPPSLRDVEITMVENLVAGAVATAKLAQVTPAEVAARPGLPIFDQLIREVFGS